MAARIINGADPRSIKEAADAIRNGGVVAFPTETVYGLGADASNPIAVARVFEIKARPRLDPLIVHIADPSSVNAWGRMPENAERLIKQFWPGPLTFVVEKQPSVPPIVTAGLDTVAIRMPAHPSALALIRESGCGIAAPSANPFGYVSPTTAQHVAEHLGDRVDLILDGGPCRVGVESTILSLVDEVPCLLRAGGISVEELEAIIGKITQAVDPEDRPNAPGQLKKHYATRTRLEIVKLGSERLNPGEKIGLVILHAPENPERYASIEILSASGDLREAAANLFSALRRLDALSLDRIIAHPMPRKGLGLAIMDRLRRCSAL